MTGLNHVRVVPDGDRFKIVTGFLRVGIGRLAFSAAGMTGDGTGLTSKEAEVQARKIDGWMELQGGLQKAARRRRVFDV